MAQSAIGTVAARHGRYRGGSGKDSKSKSVADCRGPNPDTGRISHFTTPRVPDAPSSAHAGPSLEGKLAAVPGVSPYCDKWRIGRTLWMETALQSNSAHIRDGPSMQAQILALLF